MSDPGTSDPLGPDPSSRPDLTPLLEDLVGRASVLARRLARPLRVLGAVAIAAGVAVWLLLASPFWGDGGPWWSSVLAWALLVAPGAWLLFHQAWLDRSLLKATEIAPSATAAARQAYGHARNWRGGEDKGGAVRQTWRLYRGTVSPLRRQASDVMAVAQPLMPVPLVVSGVALVAALVLLVFVPMALLIRLVVEVG
jgi:hypothetical protein